MSRLESFRTGASAIGALTSGLRAAMFIAESASKIQDAEGLEDYGRFLRAVQRLTHILTDVSEILQSNEDRLRYSSLYKVSKTCGDELVKIQKNILEWTGSRTRPRTIRTWGKFKTIALEDTSRRRLESLESHYGFINFQLNRIQPHDRIAATESRTTSETGMFIPDAHAETFVRSDHIEENAIRQSSINSGSQNNKHETEILVDNRIDTLLNTGSIIRCAKELDPLEWKHFVEKLIEGYDFDDAVGWKVDCGAGAVPQNLLHAIILDYTTELVWRAPDVRPDSYDIKDTVRKFILSGADPFARTSKGENCLHLAMQATGPSDCVAASDSRALLKDLLLFLIGEIGIDVRGETNAGISVTDLAFSFKCPSGRCLWPVWVSALLESEYDPLEVAKGSVCFDQVEQLLTTAVDGNCSCPCCYPDSEDDDIEILDRSSVDEFFADEQELWESNESIDDCPVSPESPQKTNSFHELNGLWDDNEFFEDLALNVEDELIYHSRYNISVNNLPRILEDWDLVNIE